MGSKGIKPPKRPAAPRQGKRQSTQDGAGWQLRHPPYSLEGEIEGVGRFARGVSSASPKARWVAIGVALAFIVPTLFYAISALFTR